MGDGDYVHAFQEVVMPIATEFDPDLVISKMGARKLSNEKLIRTQFPPDLMPRLATCWAAALCPLLAMPI